MHFFLLQSSIMGKPSNMKRLFCFLFFALTNKSRIYNNGNFSLNSVPTRPCHVINYLGQSRWRTHYISPLCLFLQATQYTGSKNQVRNRLKIRFVELDLSKLIFQKSSTDQQGVWLEIQRIWSAAGFQRVSDCRIIDRPQGMFFSLFF